MYQVVMLPHMKRCWIQVKWLIVRAIWQLTAHMIQVNIVVPTADISAVWPLEQKA